jgi:hypothetical protein
MTNQLHTTMLGFLIAAVASGCGDFAVVADGVCGNLVTDPGEQCDGQDSCFGAGEGEAACRFRCEIGVTQCPGALGCSVEGVCVASAGKFVDYASATRYEMPADNIVVGDLDGDHRDDVIGVGDSIRVRFGSAASPLAASYEKQIRPPTGPATIGQIDGDGGLDVVFPTAEGVFTLVSRGRELESVPYSSANQLPLDTTRNCVRSGWEMCKTIDLNRDGILDLVGFRKDLDNIEIELGRANGSPLALVIDTVDILTDIAVGDFDGDGFGDIAFAARASISGAKQNVSVVYGAPQPDGFVTAQLASADNIAGIAAADLSQPPDGIDDLAVSRTVRSTAGVAVYLGDSARDLSAPFSLNGGRASLDVPYALVVGEFVGGAGSGTDVMAYALNPAEPSQSFFWWLRGLGDAQLAVGATDSIDKKRLAFLKNMWQVGNVVIDEPKMDNGPDEVIGLSPTAIGCAGPALTVAVPSARYTSSALLRSSCLQVEGTGWAPSKVGLLKGNSPRAVSVAQRGAQWWLGQAARLDDATQTQQLAGTTTMLPVGCRSPQLWTQTPDMGTSVSWSCNDAMATDIVSATFAAQGSTMMTGAQTIATVPLNSEHVIGDFNGDGLTDLAIRKDRELTVLLQCSADMVGSTPGC